MKRALSSGVSDKKLSSSIHTILELVDRHKFSPRCNVLRLATTDHGLNDKNWNIEEKANLETFSTDL
jgi:hypothetical protein